MTPQVAFRRKIIYLAGIAVLLALLSFFGRPATRGSATDQGSPGGLLAQARKDYKLSQTQLGRIDPTSETIKLATLGMRGVATNILWSKANEQKKKKDWTNLSATLEQIARLQPNFISVWQFQAWNLSYNVSVEFEDFRQRYRWVIRGIKFLANGIQYNQREPKLVWDGGWFISQKIGKSDERRQFRRLFKNDDDFHEWRPYKRMDRDTRDNWLVGQEWFQEAERMVDEDGCSIGKKSQVIFRSDAPMCQMNYANALEEDGTFGSTAQRAWQKASQMWDEFGDFLLTSTSGESFRLNDKEDLLAAADEKIEQLEALAPGLREKIVEEKRAALSDEQREALKTPANERTAEQFTLAAQAEELLEVGHEEVAMRVEGDDRAVALDLAESIKQDEAKARAIDRYRDIVNFEYWRRRAIFEQDPDTLAARKWIYQGTQALGEDADLETAKSSLEAGFAMWRKVFDKYPELLDDATTVEDVQDTIETYRQVLNLHDEPFPKDFILQDVLDADPGQ